MEGSFGAAGLNFKVGTAAVQRYGSWVRFLPEKLGGTAKAVSFVLWDGGDFFMLKALLGERFLMEENNIFGGEEHLIIAGDREAGIRIMYKK